MKGLTLAACVLAVCVQAPASGAASFELDERSWNGVGYLLVTAREAKVDIEVPETLDFAELRPGDVVLWLYPTEPMPIDRLLSFVADGGRLVLADDRGQGAELLERLGIERHDRGPTDHGRWYRGQDGLPIIKPAGEHFLFFNVDEVVANYPSVLTGAGTPILSFDAPGEHLAVEVRQGRGAVLAVADTSLFLNEMLRRFYGNKQFAANVMRLYCDGDPCRVRLMLPGAGSTGEYRERGGPLGDVPRVFDDAVELLDEALGDLSRELAEAPWSWLIAFLAAVVGLIVALRALGRGRRPSRTPDLTGDPSLEGASPTVREAVGLTAGRRDADFGHLALTLVDQIEALAPEGIPDGAGDGEREAQLARSAWLRIRREADSLRVRQPPVVGPDRFVRLFDDVRTVARYLDESRRPQAKARRRMVRHVPL